MPNACRPYLPLTLTALLAAGLAGCNSSETADAGVKPRDGATGGSMEDATTSTADSGTNMNMGDTGVRDTGTMPGACDPVTGGGCTNGQICVYVPTTMQAQCRDPAMTPKTHEQACSTAMQDCAAGFTCVDLQNVPGGAVCTKVCDDGDDADCMNLTGTATAGYSCLAQLTPRYSVCLPTPTTCQPFNDRCPMNEVCSFIGGQLGCAPAGTAAVGAPCGTAMTGNCARGGVCINFGQGAQCWEPCDENAAQPCRNAADVCGAVANQQGMSLGFGVCRANAACSPANPTCPMGQTCQLISQTATGCVPEGTADRGQPCSAQTNGCKAPYICINFGMGAECYAGCDMTHGCGMGGMDMCPSMVGGFQWGVCDNP